MTVNGGNDVDLRIGDVVRVEGGNVIMADGSEGAGGGESIFGIITAIRPYKRVGNSPGQLQPSNVLPGGTTWTTLSNQSMVEVTPAAGSNWAIDSRNGGASYDTEQEYQTLVGKNCDHLLDDPGDDSADPVLNLTSPGTATAQWRVQQISGNQKNQDFSGDYVELVVTPNETQQAPFVVVGS
jgi:hypothetical protein